MSKGQEAMKFPPGISDLLIRSHDLKDPERITKACENVLLPITCGIQAIGQLLASAADPDTECEARTYLDTGYLLEFLADLQGSMHHMLADARYDLLNAGESVEVRS